MSFLSDAQDFMKQKQSVKLEQKQDFLETEKSRELFAHELRTLYENATWTEIYKAIDWVMDVCEKPYNKNDILKKIRIKLED